MGYSEIKNKLEKSYELNYLASRSSDALAEGIKDLTIDEIICLLVAVRDDPKLNQLSLSLSRRSDLFDKLVLMKGDKPHDWVLRLHTYNMVSQSTKPGYVISNLNREIRDDENHIHEHSWQLASRFMMGGFRNHQYRKTEQGPLYTRFNLVSTQNDGVTGSKSSRKAVPEGQTSILEDKDEVYQQGDLVHYPITIPHKVDTSLASYLGMTMTLAHTSARHHENSIFYEKTLGEGESPESDELAVEAQAYTDTSLRSAINIAITTLQLLKLCDLLGEAGFDRFNRYKDPVTKQLSPNNVLETELLPTIAMLQLQDQGEFVETPMTTELKGKKDDELISLKKCYSQLSKPLKAIILNETSKMDADSLQDLIRVSQHNLLKQLYTASCETLDEDALAALNNRIHVRPKHVINQASFFPKPPPQHAAEIPSVEKEDDQVPRVC